MIPPPEFFQQYYDYVIWGDNLQLEIVRKLPIDEYHKDRGYSFGSIHRVLRHELAAQQVWLDRFESVNPPKWLHEDPTIDSLAAIESRWAPLHERGRRYMASLTPQRLADTLSYTNTRGQPFAAPLWQPLFQMCQHAYYHRAQISSMIKQAGGEPASTDYISWALVRGKS